MKSEFDLDAYGIIGLGKFGLSIDLELSKGGKDVIVLEIEEEKLDAVKDQLANIYPVTGITQDVLKESG
ncbi:MAG: TrkA family potassium uptake protein, partial [Spirochaetia bacterium]|nr:TrkA family potassium uptake protein [Spirochaetia bacterium]